MKWKHTDEIPRDTDRPDLTPEEQASVDDVLDAAVAFATGMLPFPEAASIGTLTDWQGNESPAYSRYVAMTRTPKNDPSRSDLMALIEQLVRAEGYVVTRQGVYQPWEIRENEAGWQHANFDKEDAA